MFLAQPCVLKFNGLETYLGTIMISVTNLRSMLKKYVFYCNY